MWVTEGSGEFRRLRRVSCFRHQLLPDPVVRGAPDTAMASRKPSKAPPKAPPKPSKAPVKKKPSKAPPKPSRAKTNQPSKAPSSKSQNGVIKVDLKNCALTKVWRSDYPVVFEGIAYKWQLIKIVFNQKKGTVKEWWKWSKLK